MRAIWKKSDFENWSGETRAPSAIEMENDVTDKTKSDGTFLNVDLSDVVSNILSQTLPFKRSLYRIEFVYSMNRPRAREPRFYVNRWATHENILVENRSVKIWADRIDGLRCFRGINRLSKHLQRTRCTAEVKLIKSYRPRGREREREGEGEGESEFASRTIHSRIKETRSRACESRLLFIV